MSDADDDNKDNNGNRRVEVKFCWCGYNQFYVTIEREIVCADCHHKVENEMVFSCSTDVAN